ncbi:hypothetical protein [Vibrio owensii]|uniref:hypothetical protein n=1 Tax=Vibrio owensii TaxID=696485 RepID=UPI0040682C3E
MRIIELKSPYLKFIRTLLIAISLLLLTSTLTSIVNGYIAPLIELFVVLSLIPLTFFKRTLDVNRKGVFLVLRYMNFKKKILVQCLTNHEPKSLYCKRTRGNYGAIWYVEQDNHKTESLGEMALPENPLYIHRSS